MNEATKNEIKQQAILFRKSINRPLTDFQVRVNKAAVELALSQPCLIRKRNDLLNMARKKVADSGYVFKKGKSRSKLYGKGLDSESSESSTPKRPKLDKTLRDEKIKQLEESLATFLSKKNVENKLRWLGITRLVMT